MGTSFESVQTIADPVHILRCLAAQEKVILLAFFYDPPASLHALGIPTLDAGFGGLPCK
jgi:hypothetical protein